MSHPVQRQRRTMTWSAVLSATALAGGCVYDPVTGTYAMDPKAMEIISSLAVSSLTNSMSRGEKETVDRQEAKAAALESQSIMASSGTARAGAGPWPIEAEGEFGAYACGGHTVWLTGCIVGSGKGDVGAMDEAAATWTAARYATDNSLRWDGTPYRFGQTSDSALLMVRYDATTKDIGWVRIEHAKGTLRALTQDGSRSEVAPHDRAVFTWKGEDGGCDVTLVLVNTGDGGVFWFDS